MWSDCFCAYRCIILCWKIFRLVLLGCCGRSHREKTNCPTFQSFQCEQNSLPVQLQMSSYMARYCLKLSHACSSRVIFNTVFGLCVKYWMAITTRLILGALNGMLAPIKVPKDSHSTTSTRYSK
jgi:hypothetical protein